MPTQALTHRISTSAPQLPGGTAKQSVVSATPIAPKPATAAPTKAKRYNSLKGLTGLLKSSNQPATPTAMPTTTTATPAPSSGLPPPTTITCGHCQRTGLHYTKDCPLSCDYCHARGHVEIDCTPECPCCLGQGEIKKMFRPEVPEDVRPAVRQFHAAVKGIREAWRRLNSDNEARECRGREEGKCSYTNGCDDLVLTRCSR
jgi:hypothetical protein